MMKSQMTLLTIILSAFLLAACSGKEKVEEVSMGEADIGPDSKELLKDLPEDLVGDKTNARYTSENLRGEDEDGK